MLWATFDLRSFHRRGIRAGSHVVLLLVLWMLGFINALVHARDAWAIMPAGLILSVIIGVLAGTATWLGLCPVRTGDAS